LRFKHKYLGKVDFVVILKDVVSIHLDCAAMVPAPKVANFKPRLLQHAKGKSSKHHPPLFVLWPNLPIPCYNNRNRNRVGVNEKTAASAVWFTVDI
jgi:hypothetical protein